MSSALLSPSMLSLIATMISVHLSTKRKLCAITLPAPVTYKPAAVLTTDTSLNRARSTDLKQASVTHLPKGISSHTYFLHSNTDSYKELENITQCLIFNLKKMFFFPYLMQIIRSDNEAGQTQHLMYVAFYSYRFTVSRQWSILHHGSSTTRTQMKRHVHNKAVNHVQNHGIDHRTALQHRGTCVFI